MKIGLGSLAISLIGLSFNAQADFIQVTSSSFGAGTLTFDESQHLYWLTPNATVGKSYSQVSELLTSDVRFSGFRFAELAEVTNLFSGFGIPDINILGGFGVLGPAKNVPGAASLQSFLGVTYEFQFGESFLYETAGMYGSPFVSQVTGDINVNFGDVTIRQNSTNNGHETYAYVATTLGSLNPNQPYLGVGSWLVSSVPEPGTCVMFLTGLGLMGTVSRRRKLLQ